MIAVPPKAAAAALSPRENLLLPLAALGSTLSIPVSVQIRFTAAGHVK
jgi:hypothetical protein